MAIPGLLIWLFSVIIGCTIGVQKGQDISGFVWSFLFGPLGVLIVLCLPNKKVVAAIKRELQAQQNFQAEQLEIQRQQLELQRQQIEQLQAIRLQEQNVTEVTVRIAKDGEEIGEFTHEAVREMLGEGNFLRTTISLAMRLAIGSRWINFQSRSD